MERQDFESVLSNLCIFQNWPTSETYILEETVIDPRLKLIFFLAKLIFAKSLEKGLQLGYRLRTLIIPC